MTSRAITIGVYPAESCDYVCFTPLPKQAFVFFIFYSAFLLKDQYEPAARSLLFYLQCTDDDNKELSKRLQYVICIVFFGGDLHYKAIQHFCFSCTKVLKSI